MVLVALVPATSMAATVRVAPRPVPNADDCPGGVGPCAYAVIEYRAAAGEANRLEIGAAGPERTYRVRDDGATIQPGEGCEMQGSQNVRCTIPSDARWGEVDARLGDMDDTSTLSVEILNTFRGGAGNDTLDGSATTDYLYGDAGRDRLVGGAGSDFLFGGDEVEADTFEGGEGRDEVSYVNRTARVKVNLAQPTYPSGQSGEGDLLSGVELIQGGRGSDVLRGSNEGVVLAGNRGNDRLYGGLGRDGLFGEEGHDKIWGDGGRDVLEGYTGNDALVGGCDRDVLRGERGNDRLYDNDGFRDKLGGGPGTDFARYDQLDIVRHVERRRRLQTDACAL